MEDHATGQIQLQFGLHNFLGKKITLKIHAEQRNKGK